MIQVGYTLILEPFDNEKTEKYKCKIVDIKDDKFNIDYPVNLKLNRTAFLLTGMQLKASFVSSDNSAFLFETEVVGREKINKIDTIVMSYPGEENVIKIQRREFVRVETSLDVAVHSVNGEFEAFTTVTEDISAGGAAIILPKKSELKEKQKMKVTIVVPMQSGGINYLEIESELIRIIETDDGRRIAPIRFLDLTDNEEQIIIRLCFERQLAQRKRYLD